MGLLICSEVLLRLSVEVHHRFGERISVASQRRQTLEHGSVESAINLLERLRAWEINEDERCMSQESVRHNLATNIGRWVASTDKHDSLEADPLLVSSSVETILFSHLSQESNDDLCAIRIAGW